MIKSPKTTCALLLAFLKQGWRTRADLLMLRAGYASGSNGVHGIIEPT